MEPFEDVGLDIDRVLEAIVLGGNVLQSRVGARKRSRQAPAKQAKLVRLVAAHGLVMFDQLIVAFPREWRAIDQRWIGQARVAKKRELFRNVVDMIERVNEALRAGYQERQVGARMLSMTGGRSRRGGWRHLRFQWHDDARPRDRR